MRAIQYCLQAGNIKISEVDFLAHGFAYEPYQPAFQEPEYARKQYQELYSPEAQKWHLNRFFPGVDWNRKFIAVPHHLAHAASAFYPSGFEESLILVSDGMGEVHSMSVAVGQGTEIRILKQVPAFHSLGILYGIFTLYLGFYMNMDEYKVMGLAPYGNPRRHFDQMMELVNLKPDGTYAIPAFGSDKTPLERETHAGILGLLTERFGPPREPDGEITQRHKDIAAALQAALQTCQLHVVRHFKAETGQNRLCMAGGVALDCSLNGVLRRSRLFDRMFVQPAAGDDGCALGAALFAQNLHDPGFKPRKMAAPLWGPEFREADIRRALDDQADCVWTKAETLDELCQQVAERLAAGEIVAWFQGRMEFGPRALGSRSILADPRDPGHERSRQQPGEKAGRFSSICSGRHEGGGPPVFRYRAGRRRCFCTHALCHAGSSRLPAETSCDHSRGRLRPCADRIGAIQPPAVETLEGVRAGHRPAHRPQHFL